MAIIDFPCLFRQNPMQPPAFRPVHPLNTLISNGNTPVIIADRVGTTEEERRRGGGEKTRREKKKGLETVVGGQGWPPTVYYDNCAILTPLNVEPGLLNKVH